MSEPSPSRGPLDAAAEKFWRKESLDDVMSGVEPWRAEDAGEVDLTDAEWAAFVSALAE